MASIRINDLDNVSGENFRFDELSAEEIADINGGGIFGAIIGAIVGGVVSFTNGGGFSDILQGSFQGALAGAVLPF